MVFQSTVIRIPLCTVHHWKLLLHFLIICHPTVNICTVLPLLKRLNGLSTPPQSQPLLLSVQTIPTPTPSLFVYDLEFLALLAMGVQCLRL